MPIIDPVAPATDPLDRMSARRADAAWLEERRKDANARFMVLADLSPVVRSSQARDDTKLAWFSASQIAGFRLPLSESLFLGLDETGHAVFAICVPEHMTRLAPGGTELLRPAVDLRTLARQGVMPAEEVQMAAQARSLWSWHLNARHCGHCGGTTRVKDGGWKRKCWACGHEWFPRTDPVAIMLIVDGERCLLGADEEKFGTMYSALAGFVEHGESVEQTVRREVMEEAGIKVGTVAYVASQPWPFPHSLMIGCAGKAESTDIVVDREELSDARWFTREEIVAMIEGRHREGLSVPGPYAIANWLIRDFIDGKYSSL